MHGLYYRNMYIEIKECAYANDVVIVTREREGVTETIGYLERDIGKYWYENEY